MNVLITGRGGAGSWTIRAEQIGAQIGARVVPNASLADCKWADVILVVKRVPPELLSNIRKSGKPWVYDIVDAYPQPLCCTWSKSTAIQWVKNHVKNLSPNRVIWPNAQMKIDCGEGPVIYHHGRPGIDQNPIRERVAKIGYEGRALYLEGWTDIVLKECKARNIEFVENPKSLAELDIVLALRGGRWNGYATTAWKSNVKLANAHASGTPFIGAREAGYLETATGAEYWADNAQEFATSLDWLESSFARQSVRDKFLSARLDITTVAEQVQCALKF